MADLNYEGDSEAMVTKLVESSPKPFRAMTEKKLLAGLEAKAGGAPVTEAMVEEVVKEITPKPFVAMALKGIEELKS